MIEMNGALSGAFGAGGFAGILYVMPNSHGEIKLCSFQILRGPLVPDFCGAVRVRGVLKGAFREGGDRSGETELREIRTVCKGVFSDFCNAARNSNCLQIFATDESALADGSDPIGNLNTADIGIGKGIVTDGANALSRENGTV